MSTPLIEGLSTTKVTAFKVASVAARGISTFSDGSLDSLQDHTTVLNEEDELLIEDLECEDDIEKLTGPYTPPRATLVLFATVIDPVPSPFIDFVIVLNSIDSDLLSAIYNSSAPASI